MKQFILHFVRLICTVVLCAALCLSLIVCLAGTAIAVRADGLDAFDSSEAADVVFSYVLAAEDPLLVSRLWQIDAFQSAAQRYTRALAAWRYNDGPSWEGLSREEATHIARALVRDVLAQTDMQNRVQDNALDDLSIPLRDALRSLFPSFSSVTYGALRLQLDLAAAFLTGSAASIGAVCSILCFSLLIALYGGLRRSMGVVCICLFLTSILLAALYLPAHMPMLVSRFAFACRLLRTCDRLLIVFAACAMCLCLCLGMMLLQHRRKASACKKNPAADSGVACVATHIEAPSHTIPVADTPKIQSVSHTNANTSPFQAPASTEVQSVSKITEAYDTSLTNAAPESALSGSKENTTLKADHTQSPKTAQAPSKSALKAANAFEDDTFFSELFKHTSL